MQSWFDANSQVILLVIGAISSAILTPLFGKIPQTNWVLVVLKALLAPLFDVGHYGKAGVIKNTLTSILFVFFFVSMLSTTACSTFNPQPKVPCPGVYCIEVEGLPIPVQGNPALCWDTQEQMMAAKADFEKQGKKVTIK